MSLMKADLHIHTLYSPDAFCLPAEIIKTALFRKINCICITDHGQIKGAIETMKAGFDQNILVIPGIEIKTKLGDILGINVKKIISDGLSLEETIKEIRKTGGIAVITHPFYLPLKSFKGSKEDFLVADAIEIFNASCFNFSNKKALNFSKKYGLPFTAGSDAHSIDFVGRGFLEIQKQNLSSEKEVLEEIINKRAKIGGKNLNYWEIIKHLSIKNFKRLANYVSGSKKRKI